MSGGITQLVAIGAQDAYLVGKPEVSFFRSMYKRYTNFSNVVHRQVIQGTPAAGGMSSIKFERKGDLLGFVYLVRKNAGTVGDIGGQIAKVELFIGGQKIDEHNNEYSQDVWKELFTQSEALVKTNNMTYAFPLHFFFCDQFTSALPLVALQYHDVEVRITWKTDTALAITAAAEVVLAAAAAAAAETADTIGGSGEGTLLTALNAAAAALALTAEGTPNNVTTAIALFAGDTSDITNGNDAITAVNDAADDATEAAEGLVATASGDGNVVVGDAFECYANYTYLDDDERAHFAQNSHDMLITQVQTVPSSGKKTQDFNINHPVKVITCADKNPLTDPDDGPTDRETKLRFQLNGTDVGEPKEITPHFNEVPSYYNTTKNDVTDGGTGGYFMLPFALNVSKFQPTGTLNFSRLDSARLITDANTFNKDFYAVNYNVLRIQNGMGGLLYAN